MVVDLKSKSLESTKNPDSWIRWPLLPLRQGEGIDAKLGFLIDSGVPQVHLGNIFALQEGGPVLNYVSFEEIVADGWVVD